MESLCVVSTNGISRAVSAFATPQLRELGVQLLLIASRLVIVDVVQLKLVDPEVLAASMVGWNWQCDIGLARCDDIEKRIPRAEVKEIEAAVRAAANTIKPGCKVMCCGSYRRGKSSSGDADVIIMADTTRATG